MRSTLCRWALVGVLVGLLTACQRPRPWGPNVGDPAPAIHVAEWIRGDPISLDEARGKYIVVVEFWATWCPPCKDSIPHLSALQARFADRGVVVIGITDESPAEVRPFVYDQPSMDYRVACDDGGRTHTDYAIGGIPQAFVIDRDGTIAWIGHPLGDLETKLARMTAPSAS